MGVEKGTSTGWLGRMESKNAEGMILLAFSIEKLYSRELRRDGKAD
jgi:hypothetical protein